MATTLSGKERYRTNKQDLEWGEERAKADQEQRNVGDIQRLISAVAGIGLFATALSRRSWTGALFMLAGAGLLYRGASGYCPALGALGIDTAAGHSTDRLGRRKVKSGRATKIRRTIEIKRPPEELYRFWRSLDNLPRIMSHLQSVQIVNDRLSHWTVKTFSGAPPVEWDAEIINDVENERIGWRSLSGADVDNTGSVEFEPIGGGHATRLTVTLQYAPPAGRVGAAVAKILGEDPDAKIAQDLQRFKETMEAGVYGLYT
ncbi:MAG TPA: SRPBCC family protein [Nitrospira sp.]|nr:SRPBCC family protein [Nitrospira sp.]